MWDVAELALWANGGEELDRHILTLYCGKMGEASMKELLQGHVAMKIMAAMRLITECMFVIRNNSIGRRFGYPGSPR